MNAWMLTLPKVQAQLHKEKGEAAQQDFEEMVERCEVDRKKQHAEELAENPHETPNLEKFGGGLEVKLTAETEQSSQIVVLPDVGKTAPDTLPRWEAEAEAMSTAKKADTLVLARYTIYKHWLRSVIDSTQEDRTLFYSYQLGVYRRHTYEGLERYTQEDWTVLGYNRVFSDSLITRAAKHIVRMEPAGTIDDFDDDETLINFQNGLLRWGDMQLLPHDHHVLSSIQLPMGWGGMDLPTPVFDKFLDDLTEGDADSKRLLLEFAGVTFSNVKGYQFKQMLILQGEGNTGKSQYLALLQGILGARNCATIDLTTIEDNRFATAFMFGKRLTGYGDLGYMRVRELQVVKLITAGDKVHAENKGEKAFQFQYRGTLLYCCNQAPMFGGDSGTHVYERIIMLPCNNVIPENKRDPKLLAKMLEEAPGIVYKAILAMREAVKRGYKYTIPEKCVKRRDEYKAENSSAVEFWVECMESCDAPAARCPSLSEIYYEYKNWCRAYRPADNHVHARRNFKQAVADYLRRDADQVFQEYGHKRVAIGFRINKSYSDFDSLSEVKLE
jgi:P4 family phage/plasmid primase-like protien